MKNKVNWWYLFFSVLFSIIFGICFSLFEQDYINLSKYIINILTFTSVPALIISCMVILSVKDVQEKLKKINDYISVIADYESNAKQNFYKEYDRFLGQFNQLNRDIDIVLKQEIGTNTNEVIKRMVSASRECVKYIKSFSFVDAHIETLEIKKSFQKNDFPEEIAKEKVYLSFSNETKNRLIRLLSNIYQKSEILRLEELDDLESMLNDYKNICQTLYNKINKEFSGYTKKTVEEERLDE